MIFDNLNNDFKGKLNIIKGVVRNSVTSHIAKNVSEIYVAKDGELNLTRDDQLDITAPISGDGLIATIAKGTLKIANGSFGGYIDASSASAIEFGDGFDNTASTAIKAKFSPLPRIIANGAKVKLDLDLGAQTILTDLNNITQLENRGTGEIHIDQWRITLGNNDKYNNLDITSMLSAKSGKLDPSAYDENDPTLNPTNIKFLDGSIKVLAGSGSGLAGEFEYGKTYDLNKVVLFVKPQITVLLIQIPILAMMSRSLRLIVATEMMSLMAKIVASPKSMRITPSHQKCIA